jgi:phosphoribosylformylglycinamidine synthase
MERYDFLILPGGFLDGDDLGAAKAAVNRIRYAKVKGTQEKLFDQFHRFIEDGKLILGICNGFQLMVKLGILPGFGDNDKGQQVTLTFNDSGRFEDRWCYLKINQKSPCLYTKGLKGLYLPVRHGEGKFIAQNEAILSRLQSEELVAVQYSQENFVSSTLDYPANPNGSINGIAGICDETGRIFGLMPHPEACLHFTNHPRWTRETLDPDGDGLSIFKNAVQFIKDNRC